MVAGAAAKRKAGRTLALLTALALAGGVAGAQDAPSLNFYGLPGLIDMPSGQSAPDGQLSTTIAHFGALSRITLSFQFSPRLSGSFRYARFADWNFGGFETYYDRSFDVRYRVLDEGRYLPAVTIGLQDFVGTGLSSAEYIVATKTFADRLRVTAGLGWGRLGSYGALGTPFGERSGDGPDTGGTPNFGDWFRGPAAPFAGVEWAVNDRWTVKAEYSSDAYEIEDDARGIIDRDSPFNFGVEYRLGARSRVGVYYLYGSTIGVAAQLALNPKEPGTPYRVLPAPPPVFGRDSAAAASWAEARAGADPQRRGDPRRIATSLEGTGIVIEALRVEPSRAVVHVRNRSQDAEPVVLGRTARALANHLPPGVETFVIVPVWNGRPLSAVTLRRSDIEALVNAPDGGAAILARAQMTDAAALAPAPEDRIADAYPRHAWSIAPAFDYSLFDPGAPLMFGIGLRAAGTWEPTPGVVLRGSVTQRLYHNFDKTDRTSNSVLPHVRSDAIEYQREGDTVVDELTASYYFRPGRDLYGRITAGYLERMFAGVSAELLWKPVQSRLALGAEANFVQQRDFDGGFGLRDYRVATGHLSAYYALPGGYHAAVHAGRYLAGDWGATLEVNREFANGWRIGAFATLTDVSFEEFGEGSFDKGIHIEIPLATLLGSPNRNVSTINVRPVTRDGGARLNVNGRLYEEVRDYHRPSLAAEWGTFWK